MAPWNSRFPTWKPSFSRCSIGSTWGNCKFPRLVVLAPRQFVLHRLHWAKWQRVVGLRDRQGTLGGPVSSVCHPHLDVQQKQTSPRWKTKMLPERLVVELEHYFFFFFWNGGLFEGTFVTFRGCRNSHRPFEVSEVHHFVECLDRYFGNVCELDLIFNFHKACEFGMILPLKNPEKPWLVVGAVSICQCREIARHSITISLICTDLYNISVSAWRRKKGPCQIQSNRPWWFVVLPGDSDNSDWSHKSKHVVQSVDHPPQ